MLQMKFASLEWVSTVIRDSLNALRWRCEHAYGSMALLGVQRIVTFWKRS